MDKGEFKKLIEDTGILLENTEANLPALTKRGLAFGISGIAKVEGKKMNITVAVSKKFPNEHPTFFLLNQKDFDPIPHIEDDGFICYTHDDTLVLDIDNPAGIIQDCFVFAVQTLRDGLNKRNYDDFYNEYEAYWRRLKNTATLFTNIIIGSEVEVLKCTRFKAKDSLFVASDQTDRIDSYQRFFTAKDNAPQFFNGLFIPLIRGSRVFIPKRDTELSIQQIQRLVQDSVSEENKKRIERALIKTKLEELIVFCLPQPNGFHSLFGVRLKGIYHSKHPLLSADTKVTIIPLTVVRLDPEYMLARGGTGLKFFGKKALVIGGGSVGSLICEELIKAAVINVDVVDKETLQPENCYRHSCGFMYLEKNKAVAIKTKLEGYYPHAKVSAIGMPIEDALEKKKLNLKKYDIIIVATGNATINQYLNKVFRQEVPGKPVLYSWLDPLGIGGHCLITNMAAVGCYQCLYTNDDLHNSASFADKSQPKSFSKNITGCGTVYVPYGSLDALDTSILTVRKLLDIFLEREQENSIFSWRGNCDQFTSEGYKLSHRFFLTEEQLSQSRTNFYKVNCKVCGSKRKNI